MIEVDLCNINNYEKEGSLAINPVEISTVGRKNGYCRVIMKNGNTIYCMSYEYDKLIK